MRNISILSAQYAAAVQPFISKEITRYYLNGFCVQRHATDGATLAATTGHVLGVYHDAAAVIAKGAKDGEIIQLSKELIKACKAKQRCPMSLFLDHNTRMAYVAPTCAPEDLPVDLAALPGLVCLQAKAFIEDATFPDWHRCCPKAPSLENNAITCFDPVLLATYENVGRDMVVHAHDAGAPAWVLFGDVPEFVGVIMPRRGNLTGLPAWFSATPVAAAAE